MFARQPHGGEKLFKNNHLRIFFSFAALLAGGAAWGQSAGEIRHNPNTNNVLHFGMGPDLKMWSPLKQINKSNVKRLVPVWTFSTANISGELSQPTVYNGVMYVVNANWTFAIDVETGKQIWRTPMNYDRGVMRVASTGAIMRGAATIYDGKLYRQSLDGFVLALDMKTGKEVWRTRFCEFNEGCRGTSMPQVFNGVLVSGMSGGDSTTRGFIDGYDPQSGKRLWRTWTIPAPGEKGSETWPHKTWPDAWKYGGGATWQSASYDAELDLVYMGTGNAQPYNPKYRDGMDSLCTTCILALRPKTGEVVWYYQTTPNDPYDFDANAEWMIADLRVDGQLRKVLITAHKGGFLYVVDRTNGQLIAANPYVRVNWASGIDKATGRPIYTDLLDRALRGETVDVFPSRGTNATLIAYSPRTNLVYVNTWNLARVMKYVDVKHILGGNTTGIQSTGMTPKGEPVGHHRAFEPLTGKVVWETPMMDVPSSAAMLATDGGLLFTGRISGEMIALDIDNGKPLWQFQTGSSVNAPPITFTHKGRQYVAVQSGKGGVSAARYNQNVPAGGSVWVFALMPE
jgi:alcohol dehydrogenase (cytochrome c)